MKMLFKILLTCLLFPAFVMCLGTALFVGFGSLLARWLPLSLFQASGLAIGSTCALVACLFLLSSALKSVGDYAVQDDFVDEDDFDDVVSEEPLSKPDFSKVGRNDICPCGSGKKFKHCCEKSVLP